MLDKQKIIVSATILNNNEALIFDNISKHLILSEDNYTLYKEPKQDIVKPKLYQFLFFDKQKELYSTTIPITSLDAIFGSNDSMVDHNDGQTYYKKDYILISDLSIDDDEIIVNNSHSDDEINPDFDTYNDQY